MAKIIKFAPSHSFKKSSLFDFNDSHIEKKLAKAQEYYKEHDYENASSIFKEVLKENPDSYSANFFLGNINLNTHKIAAAIGYYKQAIKIDPSRNYLCNLNLMNALLVSRQYEEVLSTAKQCIKIFPTKMEPIKLQGIAAFHLKKYHFSLDFLKKFYERYPNDKECLHYLGAIYQNFDMLDAAVYYYEKLQKISPDDLEIKKIIGILYSHLEKYDKAASLLEEYFNLTNDFSISNELIYIYTNIDEFDKALDLLKNISIQKVNNPKIYLSMIELYILKDDKDSALKILKNGFIVNSRDPEILFEAGSYYMQLGKTDTAIYYFRKCINESPWYIKAYSVLFDIFKASGDTESFNSLKIQFLKNNQDSEEYLSLLSDLNDNDISL